MPDPLISEAPYRSVEVTGTHEPDHTDQRAHHPLEDWWRHMSEEDIGKTVPKALAYGSSGEDLVAIGRTMAETSGMMAPDGVSDDQFHAELGTFFYLTGKMARAAEAFRTGNLPSADTLFDIRIYSVIWQRVRSTGHWG